MNRSGSSTALTSTILATPNPAQRHSKGLVTSDGKGAQTSASRTVTFDTAKSSFSTSGRLVDLSPTKPLYPALERLQRDVTTPSRQFNAPSTPASPSKAATTAEAGRSILRSAPPLSRAAFAKRLRVNAVMLVMYWLVTRTQVYKLASGHLVASAPALDTPLHFIESILLLLLSFNIAESMWRINRLSTLPPSAAAPQRPTVTPKAPPSPLKYSSPKTRPSPVARAVPGSPASPLRSPASPFRTAPPTRETAGPSPGQQVSPLARSTFGNSAARNDESPLVKAYRARHGAMGLAKGELGRSERDMIFT